MKNSESTLSLLYTYFMKKEYRRACNVPMKTRECPKLVDCNMYLSTHVVYYDVLELIFSSSVRAFRGSDTASCVFCSDGASCIAFFLHILAEFGTPSVISLFTLMRLFKLDLPSFGLWFARSGGRGGQDGHGWCKRRLGGVLQANGKSSRSLRRGNCWMMRS